MRLTGGSLLVAHLLPLLQSGQQHVWHLKPSILGGLVDPQAQGVAIGGENQGEGGIGVLRVGDGGGDARPLHLDRLGHNHERLAGVAAQAGAEGGVGAVLQAADKCVEGDQTCGEEQHLVRSSLHVQLQATRNIRPPITHLELLSLESGAGPRYQRCQQHQQRQHCRSPLDLHLEVRTAR